MLNKFFVVPIEKEDVQKMDLEPFKDLMLILKANAKMSCMGITFSGYDKDKREIYEIPEIRKFVSKVLYEYPQLFFYMSEMDNIDMSWLACTCDYKMIKVIGASTLQIHVDVKPTQSALYTTFIIEYAIRHNINLKDTMSKIARFSHISGYRFDKDFYTKQYNEMKKAFAKGLFD